MAGSLSGLRCRLMMAEFMFENRVCVTIQKKVGQDRPKFFAKLFLKIIWTWVLQTRPHTQPKTSSSQGQNSQTKTAATFWHRDARFFLYPSFSNAEASFWKQDARFSFTILPLLTQQQALAPGCQDLFPFFANAAANFLQLGCLFFHISAVQKSSETLRHRDAKSFLWPSFAKCSNKLLCIYHCKSSREPL